MLPVGGRYRPIAQADSPPARVGRRRAPKSAGTRDNVWGSLYQSGQPKLSCAPAQLRYEINVAIVAHHTAGMVLPTARVCCPGRPLACPRIDTEPGRTEKGVAMTKNELADRVAQRIGIAAEQVRQAPGRLV